MKDNLILIMADQLRADVLSPELTPNIWSIKEKGVSFTRAYCACPLCVPSRGAFFPGGFPNRNGSLINPWVEEDKRHGDVKDGFDNLYGMMQDGWDSIHSGKQHLFTEGGKLENRTDCRVRFVATETTYHDFLEKNGKRRPGGLKFKTPVPEMVGGRKTRLARYSNPSVGVYGEGAEYFYDNYFAAKALEALKTRDKTKPLFLSAMFVAPHPPLEIPEPWFSRVREEAVALPENVGKFYKYQSPLQMYNLTGVIGGHYSLKQWRESWRVYLGLVSLLDDLVGQILTELKTQGIYDDSLIVFTSDHGEMLGSHSLYQKMCMYEESARVPLFMKFPEGFRSERKEYEAVVSLIDVVPTLAEYFGLRHDNAFDGVSLLPLISTGTDESLPESIFLQYDGNGSRSNFQRCVVKGKYKLTIDLFKDEYYLELYNVVDDRQETENLVFASDEFDPLIEEMLAELEAHMRGTGDLIALPEIEIPSFRNRYCTIGAKQFG
jgi:arylsulfatase A-like enzyme